MISFSIRMLIKDLKSRPGPSELLTGRFLQLHLQVNFHLKTNRSRRIFLLQRTTLKRFEEKSNDELSQTSSVKTNRSFSESSSQLNENNNETNAFNTEQKKKKNSHGEQNGGSIASLSTENDSKLLVQLRNEPKAKPAVM